MSKRPEDVALMRARSRATWRQRTVTFGRKVSDIDSERMLIRVELGKARKDRHVMLSPHLLNPLCSKADIAR